MKRRSVITLTLLILAVMAVIAGSIILSRKEKPIGPRIKFVRLEASMKNSRIGEKQIESSIGALMGIDPCRHDKEIRCKPIADVYSERNMNDENNI